MTRRVLLADSRGATLVEFAIVLPILMLFRFGAVQVGELFFAKADLRNAVANGARVASVYPRPQNHVIEEAVQERIAGLEESQIDGPFITNGTSASGLDVTDISVRYSQLVDFPIFKTSPIKLEETQRVFVQPSED